MQHLDPSKSILKYLKVKLYRVTGLTNIKHCQPLKDRAGERLQEKNSCFDLHNSLQRGQLTKRRWGKRDAERKKNNTKHAIME